MRTLFKNKIVGLLLLISPLIIIVLLVTSALLDYDNSTGVILSVVKIYSIIFFLFSSYIYQYGRNRKNKSKYGIIILNGFSIGGPTLFAWLFLLPFMKGYVGMWESQLLNLVVTLGFSYFIFFCLIGIQVLLSNIFNKDSNFFNIG